MAYDPNPNHGPVRDKMYPSEISSQRPKLATRIHCQDDPDIAGTAHSIGESATDRVNRELREGHAGRNAGDE